MTILLYVATLLLMGGLFLYRRLLSLPYLLAPLVIAILFHVGYSELAISDTEMLTNFCKGVSYQEDYFETVVTTDTKGKTHTKFVYHGPEYYVTDVHGHNTSVDRDNYERIARKFGCEPSHKSMTGKVHVYIWDQSDKRAEIIVSNHRYRNPTLLNNHVFKFDAVTKEEIEQYGLYERPKITNFIHCRSVMGWRGEYDESLDFFNARYGKDFQLRVLLLFFHGLPVESAVWQENLWRGGKKNELVLCVGLDDANNVSWTRAFSWTEVESIKANFTTALPFSEPFQMSRLMAWLESDVKPTWRRKEFADFSYITFDLPGWLVFLSLAIEVVVLVLCVVYEESRRR